MKKHLILIVLLVILPACAGDMGWSNRDRVIDEFDPKTGVLVKRTTIDDDCGGIRFWFGDSEGCGGSGGTISNPFGQLLDQTVGRVMGAARGLMNPPATN